MLLKLVRGDLLGLLALALIAAIAVGLN